MSPNQLPAPLDRVLSDARDDVAKCTLEELPMSRAYFLQLADTLAREHGFGTDQAKRAKAAIQAAVDHRRAALEQAAS